MDEDARLWRLTAYNVAGRPVAQFQLLIGTEGLLNTVGYVLKLSGDASVVSMKIEVEK